MIRDCRHDISEQETACAADGLCPLCMQVKIKRFREALGWAKIMLVGGNSMYSPEQRIEKARAKIEEALKEILKNG